MGDVLFQHGFNPTKAAATSTRSPGCVGVRPSSGAAINFFCAMEHYSIARPPRLAAPEDGRTPPTQKINLEVRDYFPVFPPLRFSNPGVACL
jgi:hypothetical protein